MFREVLVKLTEACPCKCLFCDASKKYNELYRNEVSDSEWSDFCFDLINAHVEVVILSGGEALLREKLVYKMIDLLKQNGIFVVLNTSGVLFNKKEKIDELLVHYPSLLVFSIDSADKTKHDHNRNFPGLFDRVCDSISYIKSKENFPVAIRTVITKNNYTELPQIISYFYDLGVDCIKFTHIEDDYKGEFLLSKIELTQLETVIKPKILYELSKCNSNDRRLYEANCGKINRLYAESGMSYSDYENSAFAPYMIGSTQCPLMQRFVTVQSNGDFLPCCEAEHHGWPVLGNIKSDSLMDILSSQTFINTVNFRQKYCIRCTEFSNFQIDFGETCRKVAER